jgi:hypothetical protein
MPITVPGHGGRKKRKGRREKAEEHSKKPDRQRRLVLKAILPVNANQVIARKLTGEGACQGCEHP